MKVQSASSRSKKSLINEDTVVLIFGTTSDYTRKYDLDLVREVAGDHIARRVVLLSDRFGLENVKEVALGCGGVLNDIYRVFPPSFMPNFAPIDFTQGRKQTRYTRLLQVQ